MFSPIEAVIRPSRWLLWLIAGAHLLLFGLLCLSLLPVYLKLIALLVLTVSALLQRRRLLTGFTGLRWDADRRELALHSASSGWRQVDELESLLPLPWLLVIRVRLDGTSKRLLILPDSVSAEAFRRLAVLTRLAPLVLSEPDQATRN